jgi:hypothetical protein
LITINITVNPAYFADTLLLLSFVMIREISNVMRSTEADGRRKKTTRRRRRRGGRGEVLDVRRARREDGLEWSCYANLEVDNYLLVTVLLFSVSWRLRTTEYNLVCSLILLIVAARV